MAEKDDGDKRLRKGWTTGACATAAAKSAFAALITGAFQDPVEIDLPKGKKASFELLESSLDGAMGHVRASAAIIKDAGDDPDVTHGAVIRAEVQLASPGDGVTFKAGAGVGTVTQPGLPLNVGEPAINPAPRKMIIDNLASVARADVIVTLSVDNGEKLAERTWNGRLGIVGGLSILGTTGIVIPYSCSAWIASIHQGIDVARAAKLDHIAACTGSTSEEMVRKLYDMPLSSIIDMGDFVGGTLKYLRRHPVPRLTIAGGFAKLSKLAAGHMDLHSKRSQVDPAHLAGLAAEIGAADSIVEDIRNCTTANQILLLAGKQLADVRLEKNFKLRNDLEFAIFADVFNLLNDDAYEGVVSSDSNSSSFNVPEEFVFPQRVQLGAKFRF